MAEPLKKLKLFQKRSTVPKNQKGNPLVLFTVLKPKGSQDELEKQIVCCNNKNFRGWQFRLKKDRFYTESISTFPICACFQNFCFLKLHNDEITHKFDPSCQKTHLLLKFENLKKTQRASGVIKINFI